MYQYDQDARLVLPRARLPQGERLAGFGEAGDDVALLSDRALYFYDARELENDDGVLAPRQRVPLPGATGDLQRVDAMELLDGWLVSFSFVRSSYNAEGALPFQQIVRVDDSGRVQTVARRDVASRLLRYLALPELVPVAGGVCGAEGGEERIRRRHGAAAEADARRSRSRCRCSRALLMLASLLGAVWRTRQTDAVDARRASHGSWSAAS